MTKQLIVKMKKPYFLILNWLIIIFLFIGVGSLILYLILSFTKIQYTSMCQPGSDCGDGVKTLNYSMIEWLEKWFTYLIYGIILYLIQIVYYVSNKNNWVYALFPIFNYEKLNFDFKNGNTRKIFVCAYATIILILFIFSILLNTRLFFETQNYYQIPILIAMILVFMFSCTFLYLEYSKNKKIN
ncbi:hypothetical protein [Mycoplasma hafezii]|uniref:hypothetical protein n=1 Tax=Mycoplasma hafezii TaxID=525886 RepID=UPI003CF3CC97